MYFPEETTPPLQEHQRLLAVVQAQWEQRCSELTTTCNAEIKSRSAALEELQQRVQVVQ